MRVRGTMGLGSGVRGDEGPGYEGMRVRGTRR